MATLFISLLFIAQFMLSFNPTHSCSCARSDFQTRYYVNLDRRVPFSEAKVVASWVRNTQPTGPPPSSSSGIQPFPSFNQKRIFLLHVTKVYTDCAPKVPYYAFAESSTSSAACGVSLTTGTKYLLPLKVGQGEKTSIFLCGFILPVNQIDNEKKKFLDTRKLCCKGNCECGNGQAPVNCLDSPCRTAKPPCDEATKCVDNFCGGCNAEWFNKNNNPACRPNPFLA